MATIVLAMATAIFIGTFFLGDATWVGFLRAAAEADYMKASEEVSNLDRLLVA